MIAFHEPTGPCYCDSSAFPELGLWLLYNRQRIVNFRCAINPSFACVNQARQTFECLVGARGWPLISKIVTWNVDVPHLHCY
jgi:hypothetical protein